MERKRKTSKGERLKQLGFSGIITDLHYDVLKEILIRVARSSDGGKSLIRAFSTCKTLWGLVEDGEVLRAVAFNKLSIPEQCELFQHTGGLVTRCARAGHEKAKIILAKVIMVTSSKLDSLITTANTADDLPLAHYLKQRTQSSSFVEKFLTNSSGLSHFDLVNQLFSRANLTDFMEMLPYISGYLLYFFGSLSESLRSSSSNEVADFSAFFKLQAEFLMNCKKLFDQAFTLIGDCKLTDEQALSLMRDCKLRHEHIFAQLAEVETIDYSDTRFYSLEFYEAIVDVIRTIRAAMEKETANGVEFHEVLFDVIARVESGVLSLMRSASSYSQQYAKISSMFDQICQQLQKGDEVIPCSSCNFVAEKP